jgi:hypothetical protein
MRTSSALQSLMIYIESREMPGVALLSRLLATDQPA